MRSSSHANEVGHIQFSALIGSRKIQRYLRSPKKFIVPLWSGQSSPIQTQPRYFYWLGFLLGDHHESATPNYSAILPPSSSHAIATIAPPQASCQPTKSPAETPAAE
ncbi:uncharacterized protein J3R85_006808 [Psidium guajava]|nr:uncharacterized protein J3R85_006808 [Psidium guajava]